MGTGQQLWKRAKEIIPGGNMLYSKRAEMLLPEKWPTYFKKTDGCNIWDMDDVIYKDVFYMGVGTNILGYSHSEVDEAVLKCVQDGNLSTFNAPEEVWLAERLLDLNSWADKVKFARTGGEANAIAIRAARAATGKDVVAVCGYHGWHDWYLSANLSVDDGLKEHLIAGLNVNGVPRSLAGNTKPFLYNDLDALKAIVLDGNVAAIMMEVSRNIEPQPDFLEQVRIIANKHNIILIFDECTSGFRETFGGLHKKYKIDPDIAMYGKALGNGYAITAVVGKEFALDAIQSSFVSSTFWTERIGSVAALRTLDVMEREKSWEKISGVGNKIKDEWQNIAELNQLEIDISGLAALPQFRIKAFNGLLTKTYITQEMLKHGFLAGTSVYVSLCHTEDVLAEYYERLSDIFKRISQQKNDAELEALLETPVAHGNFQRLN